MEEVRGGVFWVFGFCVVMLKGNECVLPALRWSWHCGLVYDTLVAKGVDYVS